MSPFRTACRKGAAVSAIVLLALAGCRARPSAPPLTLDQFAAEVSPTSGCVVVNFTDPWCAPCQRLNPVIAKVAPDYAGRLRFFELEINRGLAVAQKYDVGATPTLIFFRAGRPVDSQLGARSEAELRAWLDDQLKSEGGEPK